MTLQPTGARALPLALLLCACGGTSTPTTPPPAASAPSAATAMPPTGLPLAQWSPEQRQVAYRNFEKVMPGPTVKRGASVHALTPATRQIEPLVTFDDATLTAARFMELNGVSGLIAVKNGAVVLERYAFGRAPDDRWVSFSVTKSMTSTLLGTALADGHIKSLHDPVTRYLPALKGSVYDKVTIRDLITMRSGAQWNEDYGDPDADVWKVGMLPPVDGVNPTLRYMKGLQRAAPAGQVFSYNTGETDLAGLLVSAAVGKPLHQYLSEKIWAPFGMERDASWPADTGGHERGGCCLAMTLRDYARFGLFMLGGGQAGGKHVVPTDWVAQATTPQVTEPGYGYFWWTFPHAYAARGIYGQAIYVYPEEQLVVAVNSAWPVAWEDTYLARQEVFVDAIRRAAAGISK